nr:DUF5074 domain-containing protein [uncultured Porphyromonas sp.]
MTKKILWASLALVVGFASCKKDDPVEVEKALTRELSLSFSNNATAIQQIEPIVITATGEQASTNPSGLIWRVNGKEVARGTTYTFRPGLPGTYSLNVSSSDGNVSITRNYTVEPRFTKGAFLLNEGNGTDNVETGTLTYVDVKGKVILDSAYIHVNGTKLGHVCQDLAFANEKIYIISQNGKRNGGEGLLTIAKANTLEKIKVFNDATLAKEWPTHIAVIGDRIYLRANDGIHVGTENGGFKLIAGTEKAQVLRMAAIGQRVFASTSDKKLLMIQGDQVVKELILAEKATGLALADDGNLWVAISNKGSNNQILKVSADPADFKIITSNVVTESTSVGWGSTSAIFATGNTIYFSGGTTTIRKHDFAAKTTSVFANILEAKYAPELKTFYNSLGVDPKTGYVYYSGIKGFGKDYKINSTFVLDPQGNVLVKKDNTNSFPAGWYFIPQK